MTTWDYPGTSRKGTHSRDHSELAAFKLWLPLIETEETKICLVKHIYVGQKAADKANAVNFTDDSTSWSAYDDAGNIGAEFSKILHLVGWSIRHTLHYQALQHAKVGIRYLGSAADWKITNFQPSRKKQNTMKGFGLLNAYFQELGDLFYINPAAVSAAFWKTVISTQQQLQSAGTAYGARVDVPGHLVNEWIQTNLIGHHYSQGLPLVAPTKAEVGYLWNEGGAHRKSKSKKYHKKAKYY